MEVRPVFVAVVALEILVILALCFGELAQVEGMFKLCGCSWILFS